MIDSSDPWTLLLLAVGLMLVLEGLLPFLSPERWRSLFESAAKMSNGQLRFLGLASLVVGCGILLFMLG
ncbi:MAG: DUF2065 domain-containing protein [Pseudomonadota bacterium]|nr:DUF2065 domain-containing protein [Pseudomonadota bacterium]